jgi:hypothetical protein
LQNQPLLGLLLLVLLLLIKGMQLWVTSQQLLRAASSSQIQSATSLHPLLMPPLP